MSRQHKDAVEKANKSGDPLPDESSVETPFSFDDLSVVIPTKNRPEFLGQAVKECAEATGNMAQIIVVNDGDPIVGENHQTLLNNGVMIFDNPGEGGAASARNFGASKADRKILLFLDDDDLVLRDYPGQIVSDANSGTDFVWGGASHSYLLPDREIIAPQNTQGKIATRGNNLKSQIQSASGLWIMRELFNRIGGFNENQRVDEDTELSARLIGLEYTPRHSDSPGVLVRRGWQDDTGKSTQLTFSTADERITQCYLRTYSENAELFHNRPHDKIFLIKRYLRRAAKSRGISEPLRHVRDFSPKLRVPDLMMYLLVKKARSGIKHAFGRP